MKKYKVELEQVVPYIIDVRANNPKEAEEKAFNKFSKILAHNIEHYYQYDEAETSVRTVYDVSNTDDPFNP